MYFLLLCVPSKQGSPTPALEGPWPACLRCFPASAHLIQMNGSPSASHPSRHRSFTDPLIWLRCAEAGKHQRHAGQRPSKTGVWDPCFKATVCGNISSDQMGAALTCVDMQESLHVNLWVKTPLVGQNGIRRCARMSPLISLFQWLFCQHSRAVCPRVVKSGIGT